MKLSSEDQKKLIEAQLKISESLQGINATLTKINDQNVLHIQDFVAHHISVMEKLTVLTAKYWWLIMVLVLALVALAGAEKIFNFMPGV